MDRSFTRIPLLGPSLTVVRNPEIRSKVFVFPPAHSAREREVPSWSEKIIGRGSSELTDDKPIFPRITYLHPAAKAKSFASDRSSGTGFLEVVTMVIELVTL
jgi:hypothetical protein